MSRPRLVWACFAACFVVVLLVMGWVTWHTLRLDASQQRAAEDSEKNARLRLALWRMDSLAGNLVFLENARPPAQFKDFHAADQLYTQTFQLVQKGKVMMPSPVLSEVPDHAKLYFQVDEEGSYSSPQVPEGNRRDLAEQNYTTRERIEAAAARLEAAEALLGREMIREEPEAPSGDAILPSNSSNGLEYQQRARLTSANQMDALSNLAGAKLRTSNSLALEQAAQAGVNLDRPDEAGSFAGLWRGGELFLRRLAYLDGRRQWQHVWLKARELETRLLHEIRDLFPAAQLRRRPEPEGSGEGSSGSVELPLGRLVALPYDLHPGPVAGWGGAEEGEGSPVRRSLVIAWVAVMLSSLAACGLIAGILSLSERRAAFVSAVTHEMRTPLTTFRLYSDMLASRRLKDPEMRERYLATLRTEANRLTHLVENVLTYARLEKGKGRAEAETLTLGALTEQLQDRLNERVRQEGGEWLLEIDEEARETVLAVDRVAVEQILFNLVDNACKYGRCPEGPLRVRLKVEVGSGQAVFRVEDDGPGIARAEARRLFRPFQKSAHEAAHSAPGVGLGLGLCRQLSRRLGGDLVLEASPQGGRFRLLLPLNGKV